MWGERLRMGMRDAFNGTLGLASIAEPVTNRDFFQVSTIGMILHAAPIASKHMFFVIILSAQWTCLVVNLFFDVIGEQGGIDFSDLRTVGNGVG